VRRVVAVGAVVTPPVVKGEGRAPRKGGAMARRKGKRAEPVGDAERDVWGGTGHGEWEVQALPGQLSLFDLAEACVPGRAEGERQDGPHHTPGSTTFRTRCR